MMHDIRMLLKRAARRLELSSFLGALHLTAIVAAAVLLVLAIADRLPAASYIAWTWTLPALAGLCLIAAMIIWSQRRLNELQVALAVDDRLDLRERLSTALHCQDRSDAFARAAVEDAVQTARNPRMRETVRRRFAVVAPRHWWISPVMIVVAVGVLFMPQIDLFASEPIVDEQEWAKAKQEAEEELEAVVEVVEDKQLLKSELAGIVSDLDKPGTPTDQLRKPEDLKRDALKKVTKLNRKLDEILNGEKGKTADALEDMLSKLKRPGDGPANEMADALARGDFKAAKEALEAMMEQARNGEMNAQQQEQLAQQMENLAQQLEQLAQQQDALEQALQQAGLNPQLANNPQALQQALQQAQNLNQQQKQQLQQMAQAQQAACQMCQGLGQACQGMADAMKQGGGGGGQAGADMAQQLNDMEQLQQLLMQAQAAANQMQGQQQGAGLQQALQQMGGGMGQRGQGAGGKAPLMPTPTGKNVVKENVPVTAGEIIASTEISGQPITGEVKSKLKEVAAAAAKGYDEAQDEQPLPRRYWEALQSYFGELEKRVEAVPAAEDDASDQSAGSNTTGSEADEPGE
jgi:DNA segregation ATPase FtsK/SpoIIIE-like protein